MKIIRNILTLVGLISSIIIFIFFFPNTWGTSGDMFDWTTIKKYPNNKHLAEAIVRHGVPNNGSSTVPFYSVLLQTINKDNKNIQMREVWSSQHNIAPKINWIDNNYIEIIQINDHIWEYTPSVTLNKEHYKIRLKILP